MTAPDLSKLRIDRGAPAAGVSRALKRNAIFAGVVLAIIAAAILWLRRGAAVPVQTVVATASGGAEAGGASTSVTANGYVVARTRASVSAKVAGRLAEMRVSEGSFVRQGETIARLENADYRAQVAQAEANLSTARAQQIEAEAERDQLQREARRLKDIHTQNAELVSEQDVEAAAARAAQSDAREAPHFALTSHARAAGCER